MGWSSGLCAYIFLFFDRLFDKQYHNASPFYNNADTFMYGIHVWHGSNPGNPFYH